MDLNQQMMVDPFNEPFQVGLNVVSFHRIP